MDLLQNPFHILNASPGDNLRRIMELADERSLLLDSNECTEASTELTSPRKRLTAEIAWLPGIGPNRAVELLSLLESSPSDLLTVDNVSSIARSNLLAAGLARLPNHNADEIADWILEIAWAFEDLDADELCEIINQERTVSGFPEVSDLFAVEAEIQERRRHYRQVIKSALDHLSPKELVKAVTVAVASSTEDGEEHGPVVIADLVDSYEVEAQGFIDKEEGNIKALVEKLRAAVDAERSDSTLAPLVNQLIQVVKNWDTVAQPIQVSAKSRGLDHDASHRVAGLVRGLAIDMFNEHGKLDFSQQLTNMLQEVFAEVGEVAERTAEDADALGEIAEQRFLHAEVSKIEALTTEIKADVEGGRSDTYLSPKVNQLCQLVMNWEIDPEHDASQHTAWVVRNLAIHMFNKHDKLDFAQQLTKALLGVFDDAGEISDRIADDAKALQEIATIRSMLSAGIPQPAINTYLKNVKSGRTNLTPQQAIDFWKNKNKQQSESTTKPTDTSTKREESLKLGLANPQAQPGQPIQQPSVPQKTVFALLKLTKWPTLPLPWSSVDSGETWVWGDFFLTFQKKPKTFEDITVGMQGEKAKHGGMTYHYAMTVFYRIDRNPHGPSHRPIMIIGLEQADMGMLAKVLGGMLGSEDGELLQAEGGDQMGPLVIGLFTGEKRLNLGVYEGGRSSQAVKQRFFEILGRQLGVSGQPKMIGDLAQAHGHPETGLPAKKQNSGCAPVIVLCIVIGGLGAWGLTFI
jgi:hypothetical protein